MEKRRPLAEALAKQAGEPAEKTTETGGGDSAEAAAFEELCAELGITPADPDSARDAFKAFVRTCSRTKPAAE